MENNLVEELLLKASELCERLSKQANSTEAFIKTIRKTSHWKNPNLYKTSICDHWRNKKKCKYGPKCWYAHGSHELRSHIAGVGQLSETFNGLSMAQPQNLNQQQHQSNGHFNGMGHFQQPPPQLSFDILDSKMSFGDNVQQDQQSRVRMGRAIGSSLHSYVPEMQYQPSTQQQQYNNHFGSDFWLNDPIWDINDTNPELFSSISPPGQESQQQQQPPQQDMKQTPTFASSYHLFRDQPFQSPLQKFVVNNHH